MILSIHIVSVGLWLGCVLTEALFERALLGTGRENEKILAHLHRRVDLIIEIPAFVLVILTGTLMLIDRPMTTLLMIKVALGILAVVANAYCVRLVFLRVEYSNVGDWGSFERADNLQHKVGAIVLVSILGALGIGITGFA